MLLNFNSKGTNYSYKRRLINKKECLLDLRGHLTRLFLTVEDAINMYNVEVRQTPPQARVRGFEASLLNSKIIQYVQRDFPDDWHYGKYKRFALTLNDYIVLIKKLSSRDMPMNISTINDSIIKNQLQGNLFADDPQCDRPLLFFGYKRNHLGEIIDPKVVYIDEERVKWTITREEILGTDTFRIPENPSVSPSKELLVKRKQKKNNVI